MIRIRRFLPILLVAFVGAAVLGLPSQVKAAFTVTLHETGFADLTITDEGAGDLAPGFAGLIIVNGTFGDFTIQSDTASSNSGSHVLPANLTINQLSIRNTSSGSKTLTITVSDDGFDVPSPGLAHMISQLSTTALTAGSDVSFQSFLDGSGGTILSLNTSPGAAGPADDLKTIAGSSYTLSNVTTINVVSGGTLQSTGTTEVTAVPAPAGLVLALVGAPVFGIGTWLRRRRTVKA